jgi:UPF0755 protein
MTTVYHDDRREVARPDDAVSRRRRRARVRERRRNVATLLAVVALLVPLALGGVTIVNRIHRGVEPSGTVTLDVQAGSGFATIADTLHRLGVIASSAQFQTLAAGSAPIGAGTYRLVKGVDPRDVLAVLHAGPIKVAPDQKLLVPPGLTLAQIAQRVGKLNGKSADKFTAAVLSGSVRSKYFPSTVSLEGLTWPDTYFIGADESEASILKRIVAEFDKHADAVGLTSSPFPYATVIIASLVQAEAGNVADEPNIAAVVANRLNRRMPLQIDSTLCYAKGGCGPGGPVEADKKVSSPYNTYAIIGLPPTPIQTLGDSALRAALHPANVSYLFFVTGKDGKALFANTQAEHDNNVAKVRSGR